MLAKSHDLTKSWYNVHAKNVTGPPCVSPGSKRTSMFTDRCTNFASGYATMHDGGVLVVTKFRNAKRLCLHHEVAMSTLSERSQGEEKHAERLLCGKQTKAELWDIERLDQKVGCAVDGDCSHSKRAVQEWWTTS